MKRFIIVTVVIALLAVAVFGGQALAGKPEKAPDNAALYDLLLTMNQTITDTQIELTNVPRIETGFSYDSASEDVRCSGDAFPEIRHCSITMYVEGLDEPDDRVDITMQLDDREVLLYQVKTNGFKTFEFDATNSKACFYDYGGDPIESYIYATLTWWEGYPEGSPLWMVK